MFAREGLFQSFGVESLRAHYRKIRAADLLFKRNSRSENLGKLNFPGSQLASFLAQSREHSKFGILLNQSYNDSSAIYSKSGYHGNKKEVARSSNFHWCPFITGHHYAHSIGCRKQGKLLGLQVLMLILTHQHNRFTCTSGFPFLFE